MKMRLFPQEVNNKLNDIFVLRAILERSTYHFSLLAVILSRRENTKNQERDRRR